MIQPYQSIIQVVNRGRVTKQSVIISLDDIFYNLESCVVFTQKNHSVRRGSKYLSRFVFYKGGG